jgi:hypothetical protein
LAEDRCWIDRTHPAPDYLFRGVFGEAFIEAVTANPNDKVGEPGYPDAANELANYQKNYLPIKFAGPLTRKLEKRYWDEPYIANRPIILAIADFHQRNSMGRSQNALLSYLYGQQFDMRRDEAGRLRVTTQPITEHVWNAKSVPSGFFSLPNAENISAVMSTGRNRS